MKRKLSKSTYVLPLVCITLVLMLKFPINILFYKKKRSTAAASNEKVLVFAFVHKFNFVMNMHPLWYTCNS